jgi:hypothetical protein
VGITKADKMGKEEQGGQAGGSEAGFPRCTEDVLRLHLG